jgi:anti-sigma B factor antagonist
VRPLRGPDRRSAAVKRPLLINTRRYGDLATYIALLGELDLASADELDAVIRDAEETEVGQIVVDLSGVSFLDSTGLRALLSAKMRSDGRLRYHPSCHDAVTRLLQATGTLALLD